MLIVCKPEKRQEIFDIFKKWDLEYGEIGIVNNTGNYQIYHEGRVLYNNMMSNLNEVNDYTYEKTSEENRAEKSEEHVKKIHEPNRWKVYDSTVGNRTLKGPDKPGSYAILDIPENNKQLFVTWGETFEECHKQMTIFEGVKPLCVVNCLNFGHPSDSMNDFSDTIDSLVDGCTSNNIPVVGGNVSLYNSTDGKSIRPTPVLLMMGISV
jgi:phosphoribosylformylglycinamidine synthase